MLQWAQVLSFWGTPSRKSKTWGPTKYARVIQHRKEVQREAGMLALRDVVNQRKQKKLKYASELYSGKSV